MGEPKTAAESDSLRNERVAFLGKLGAFNRKEAYQLVRSHGGTPVDAADEHTTLLILGAEEFPFDEHPVLADSPLAESVAAGRCRVVNETDFQHRLGLLDVNHSEKRLYTPAMLADLLEVSVATIRRWHRRGLIVPVREVRRLPYFDFQEVASARQIARLVAAGTSPAAIENKLVQLAKLVPAVERPLAQLSVIVEGRNVLLRQGEGLIDSDGQLRIDFDALEPAGHASGIEPVVSFDATRFLADQPGTTGSEGDLADQLLAEASEFEEAGQLSAAAESLRAWLMAKGPSAEVTFQLAEMLYRLGDLTAARERYFMAIELNEDYVEARANLGCLLAELGDDELAVASFRGALRYHPDYPDVHFHLARTLDDQGLHEEAQESWHRFLELAPDSPWAEEARQRLGLPSAEPLDSAPF